jgi:hypothetical protein
MYRHAAILRYFAGESYMKYHATSLFLLCAALGMAQAPGAPRTAPTPSVASSSDAATNLDVILGEIQQATQSANSDITRLHIDRWKADGNEKAQLQQVADSLHKNITRAVPDLLSDVRTGHGSISSTFRLYHDVNVVFEYLNSLTDAAGSLGKKEEYDPLNSDTTALDKARQHLSTYIEQAAANLETKLRTPAPTASPTPAPQQASPKRIVIDDDTPQKKKTATKKKAATPPSKPSPTPN